MTETLTRATINVRPNEKIELIGEGDDGTGTQNKTHCASNHGAVLSIVYLIFNLNPRVSLKNLKFSSPVLNWEEKYLQEAEELYQEALRITDAVEDLHGNDLPTREKCSQAAILDEDAGHLIRGISYDLGVPAPQHPLETVYSFLGEVETEVNAAAFRTRDLFCTGKEDVEYIQERIKSTRHWLSLLREELDKY